MHQQFSGVKVTPLGLLALSLVGIAIHTGCSEGPLWKMGHYSPWVQEKWAAEERLAETVYAKRRKLESIASKAASLSPADADSYAAELAEQYRTERTLIVKVETVRTLGKIPSPQADAALAAAVKDPEVEVRIAAVHALTNRDDVEGAVSILSEVIGSDTNDDVRREALRSLGEFSGQRVVATLATALEDRDPATQYRAIESLRLVTGKNFGPNVAAWREYLGETVEQAPASIATQPDSQLR